MECIKTIDCTAIDGTAAAFSAAAAAVVLQFAGPDSLAPEMQSQGMRAATGPDPLWESERARALNVIFLDLCAQISGRRGESLVPLHWGFWPADTSKPIESKPSQAYDPQAAYSEHLLAFIPAGVSRVLDVGCGLGYNAKLLSQREMQVTAVSPVAHHCAVVENAGLPGVEVKCARFEEMSPAPGYDLLLFSESVNHFSLDEDFFKHCKEFLRGQGFLLMADDLADDRTGRVEAQSLFRVVRSADITENVAPTIQWWAEQMPMLAAYSAAMASALNLYDPELARRVLGVIGKLENDELQYLFSGETPPAPKSRYMIYLLQSRQPVTAV